MLLIPIRGVGWGGNKCMRRVKVRRHNIMTKYFHVCFSINWFLCLVICSDVLLGSSVKSQGSVFLGKPEKLLLHRNLPINQESPCPTDFPGASLRQKQDKFAQCYQMWGPSWLTTMVAPGPNFWLLSIIWHLFDPGHLNRPEANFPLRNYTEKQISMITFLMCFTIYKPLKVHYFPWSIFVNGAKLLYNVMLVSAIQQCESDINTHTHTHTHMASLVAQMVKNLPEM